MRPSRQLHGWTSPQQECDQWNHRNPPGTPVQVWRDGGAPSEAKTTSLALVAANRAVVYVSGRTHAVPLSQVKRVAQVSA
jgi:hypothetical protein